MDIHYFLALPSVYSFCRVGLPYHRCSVIFPSLLLLRVFFPLFVSLSSFFIYSVLFPSFPHYPVLSSSRSSSLLFYFSFSPIDGSSVSPMLSVLSLYFLTFRFFRPTYPSTFPSLHRSRPSQSLFLHPTRQSLCSNHTALIHSFPLKSDGARFAPLPFPPPPPAVSKVPGEPPRGYLRAPHQ